MRSPTRVSTAVLILTASVRPLTGQQFVVRDVRLFDGTRTTEHRSVLVDSGRIVRIGAADMPTRGATEVDGRGRTLMPGFIDSHVHVADDARSALRQAIVFGVTTVLDMFSSGDRFARVKAMQDSDPPDLADVRSAGVGATVPGGHPTLMGGPSFPTISSAAEAAAWVDARIAEGSDYIKIIRDDLSNFRAPVPTLDSVTIAAIVREAHARGKLVVAHVTQERDARLVLGAGVDGLAHLFRADTASKDFGEFVAAHHAFVIPTLVTFARPCGRSEGASLANDPLISPYLAPLWRTMLTMTLTQQPAGNACFGTDDALRQLAAAHVPMLAGTDAPFPGTSYGASIHAELAQYVRDGLSPEAALITATSVPARVFHLTDRGTIEAGKRADLLLVDGDPSHDIAATKRIVAIWKKGKRIER